MSHLRRRMVPPDAFSDPGLEPPEKRLLYLGLHALAEDSGCVLWNPLLVRGAIFPYSEHITREYVAAMMDDLEAEGRAWTYTVASTRYGYLPTFPIWQAKMIVWHEPTAVPLPAGVTFTPSEHPTHRGRGTYTFPTTRDELLGAKEREGNRKGTETNKGDGHPDERGDERGDEQGENSRDEQRDWWREFVASYPKSPRAADRTAFDGLTPGQRHRAILAAKQRVEEAKRDGTEPRYLPSVKDFLADPTMHEVLAERREAVEAAEREARALEAEREERQRLNEMDSEGLLLPDEAAEDQHFQAALEALPDAPPRHLWETWRYTVDRRHLVPAALAAAVAERVEQGEHARWDLVFRDLCESLVAQRDTELAERNIDQVRKARHVLVGRLAANDRGMTDG